MVDEGLCSRCRSPRLPEDARCRVCGSELPPWTEASTPQSPAEPPDPLVPSLPAPPTGEPSPVLSVPAILSSAPPAAEPPAKRRLPIVEVLVVVAVLAVAGIAFALLTGGDDDGSPAAVADPSTAASSSPASSATSSPSASTTPSPSPEPSPTEEGPSISVQGVEIRLSSASRKERYVSGDETFVPGVGGDIFLIVRGTFEGEGDRIHDFDVTVVDENGRRDGTSFGSSRSPRLRGPSR